LNGARFRHYPAQDNNPHDSSLTPNPLPSIELRQFPDRRLPCPAQAESLYHRLHKTKFGNLRETIMPISWEQPDIFPAIARIIAHSFESSGDFVTHETIVAALLNDSEAAPIIAHATEQSPEPHTSDWMAHNMAAWFSQRITVGGSDWAQRFERTKINGKWAYRPKSSSAS